MAASLSASEAGLKIFEQARKLKCWNKTASGKNSRWPLDITKSTLERFHKRQPIQFENFVAICSAVGIEWQQIADLSECTAPTEIVDSNSPIDIFVSTELDIFAKQIFDWFGALKYEIEGDPKCDRNYVEAIVRVPVRSRFDRILIHIINHEASLGDLDCLCKVVGMQQVDEGWLVTDSWVSQAVKQAVNKSENKSENKKLICLTFDELIDQDANFTPYLDWLEREISKREIDKYYVDLGCTKGEFDADTRTLRGTSKYSVADGGIDRYIDRWLENPVTEHVSILGEFGTGKTWFAFHYAGKCLQAYREAKSKGMPRPRLPLVIPLRDYAKALNVENVLAGFFYTQHNIRLNSDVFDRLNRMGKLLLIFDGFDEMADKIDTQKMTDNFWELAKVVTPNAKVILTCRTEHFPTAQDGRENLGGERIPSTANKIAVAPKFETLELMKFDDAQIREVLSRRTNLATVELVMANSQLLDLLRRAVMAEFVLEALPEIEAGKPIDLARVYLYAVRHKMERDITTGRTFTSLADKLYFLCELAWEMLSEDKMSINYREFPDRLRVLFKDEVKEQKHLDHWHYDMMGQTMLIRNDDGDYSPAHRSLLEFFVAYKFAAELGLLADDFLEMAQSQSGIDESLEPQLYKWSEYWRRDVDDNGERKLIAPLAGFMSESPKKLRENFGKSPLTKAIIELLFYTLNLDTKYRELNHLLDLIKSTKAGDVGYLGGNAATVLVRLNSDALDYEDLNDTNLAHADLVNAGLRKTNLSGANLENSLTTRFFGIANAILMTQDNRQLISAHDDNTIIIWDRASRRDLQKLAGHQGSVTTIALSGDGKFLYSGSSDRTIKQWDVEIKQCLHTFDGHQGSVTTIALSGDGKSLYSGSSDRTIKQWDIETKQCLHTFDGHQKSVNAIVLSGNDQSLYSGSDDNTIKKWNIKTKQCLQTFEGHQKSVNAIVLSEDDQSLYSGSDDNTIRKWNLVDGENQQPFEGHQGSVRAIFLSADGQSLYSCNEDRIINEWNLADGKYQQPFEGHNSWVNAIALSRDEKSLYSCGYRTINKWNLEDSKCQQTFKGHDNWVNTIYLSFNEQILYSGSDDNLIKIWRIDDGKCLHTFEGHQGSINSILLSNDGQFLYSGSSDSTIKKWKISDYTCQHTFIGHKGPVHSIMLSEDNKLLYSSSEDGTIKEWIVADRRCKNIFEDHQANINEIILSKDGRFLYSASRGKICQWNLAGSEDPKVFDNDTDWVNTIVLSENGQFLYSNSNFVIRKCDTVTKKFEKTIDTRLCAGANITNVKGLTPAQTDALLALGAFSDG